MANVDIDLGKYSLGWSDPEKNVFKPEKGLNEEIIRKNVTQKHLVYCHLVTLRL